jgi:hypothetical protein
MHRCDKDDALLRALAAPRHSRFFYGKPMDVKNFQMEQDYGKLKQWLVNRLAVGKGVLCGLRVSIDQNKLCVDPGVAFDGLGREIVVPVRACLDPVTQEGGCCPEPCCGERGATPATPNADSPGASDRPRAPMQGIFTLWVCYRECKTDYQPVLVSECETREQCEAGTIVETFCLKVTPGLPLQTDPAWCAKLWKKADPNAPPPPNLQAWLDALTLPSLPTPPPVTLPAGSDIKAALESYRHQICELFDGTCDPTEGDVCVPLAGFIMRDGRIAAFDSCLVRPRIYSNAVLFDLILCLMARIDECCDGHQPPPPPPDLLRVASVEFLDAQHNVIASVADPGAVTSIPIDKRGMAIRVRFTAAFDQGAHKPTTPNLGDPNFKRHNVLVAAEKPPDFGFAFVPGSLVIEDPKTIRWELSRESPYFEPQLGGWQKGVRRMRIFGDDDPGIPRLGIVDISLLALDGEPMVPAGGVMSGNGTAGGEFTFVFQIG